MAITKEKFLKYEAVRKSGKYNMLSFESLIDVLKETGLYYEEYLTIIGNYDKYSKKYIK